MRARTRDAVPPVDARPSKSPRASIIERRVGLLDPRPARGDERAMRAARDSHASTPRARAEMEASRLRAVSSACASFQRACERRLGKRWCSALEGWLATADATTPAFPRGEKSRAFLVGKLRANGASDAEAETTCEAMMRMMEAREREVGRDAGNARESEARAEVARTREGDVVVLRLGKTSVRLNREHFDKLRALYEMSRGGVDEGAFLRAARCC